MKPVTHLSNGSFERWSRGVNLPKRLERNFISVFVEGSKENLGDGWLSFQEWPAAATAPDAVADAAAGLRTLNTMDGCCDKQQLWWLSGGGAKRRPPQ